jgi:hypothetical protein
MIAKARVEKYVTVHGQELSPTNDADPSEYWKMMRKRNPDLGKALQGGDNLYPPCFGVCDGGRHSEISVLEH